MKRCAHCGTTKLGLVRYRLLTFSGYLQFCSALCNSLYVERVRKEVKAVVPVVCATNPLR
jgi:hypothetical protein